MMKATEQTMRTRPGRTNKPSFSSFISQRPCGPSYLKNVIKSVNVKWSLSYICWTPKPEFKYMNLHVCQLILANVHISLHYRLPELHPPQCRRHSGGSRRGRHQHLSWFAFSEPSWPDPEKLLPAETEKDNYMSKPDPKVFNPASQQIIAVCYLKSINPQRAIQPVSKSFLLQWIINVSEKSHTVFTVTCNVS